MPRSISNFTVTDDINVYVLSLLYDRQNLITGSISCPRRRRSYFRACQNLANLVEQTNIEMSYILMYLTYLPKKQ